MGRQCFRPLAGISVPLTQRFLSALGALGQSFRPLAGISVPLTLERLQRRGNPSNGFRPLAGISVPLTVALANGSDLDISVSVPLRGLAFL